MTPRLVSTFAALCVLAAAPVAHGQVLEIGLDGAATLIAGPSVYTEAGASPIRQAILTARPSAAPEAVGQAIAQASIRHGLSGDLLSAVAWQESRFRQTAVSPKGASGVMQLMPGTARALGVNPADLTQNVDGGAAYLRQMLARYDGDVRLALAAYNAGPSAVDRHGGVPPYAETQGYVTAILGRLAAQSDQAAIVVSPSPNPPETVANLSH